MEIENPYKQKNKVGLSIKIPIIILTFLTLIAMGAVFTKFLKSPILNNKKDSSTPAKASSLSIWTEQLPLLGARLDEAGLYEQAVQQYIKYLETASVQGPERATAAHKAGRLYQKLGNCGEALVWFYHAELNQPPKELQTQLNQDIDSCLTNIRRPKN
jgi:tetratricopeptide (TPR) repeat protein